VHIEHRLGNMRVRRSRATDSNSKYLVRRLRVQHTNNETWFGSQVIKSFY